MITDPHPSFLSIAMDRHVRKRAMTVALFVGSVLAVINHGNRLVAVDLDAEVMIKIALTYLVPYAVSTYSAVQAVRDRQQS